MRLIDADKLIEVLNKKSVPFNANVNDAILTAPTVEERKKGKWIVDKDCEGKTRYVTCNLCGHKEFNWNDPNFCPNCGADMREESEVEHTPDCPFCVRYGTDECLKNECKHLKSHKERNK